jgi:hypothetical protein
LLIKRVLKIIELRKKVGKKAKGDKKRVKSEWQNANI